LRVVAKPARRQADMLCRLNRRRHNRTLVSKFEISS
jgi:hypothetical protein